MGRSRTTTVISGIGLVIGMIIGSYYYGRHTQSQITWYSELVQRVQGTKNYLINLNVVCGNGKNLGMLQVDLNLRNGKMRIVRNDPGLNPDCSK